MSQADGGAVTEQPRSDHPAVSPAPSLPSVRAAEISAALYSFLGELFSSGIKQKEGRGKRVHGPSLFGCKLGSGLLFVSCL